MSTVTTVTTVATRVLVAGVCCGIYTRVSVIYLCIYSVSTVVYQYHGTTYRSTTIYYMYVLYINNVSVILHRVSSSIHTVAYMYNCIAVSVSRVRVSQV